MRIAAAWALNNTGATLTATHCAKRLDKKQPRSNAAGRKPPCRPRVMQRDNHGCGGLWNHPGMASSRSHLAVFTRCIEGCVQADREWSRFADLSWDKCSFETVFGGRLLRRRSSADAILSTASAQSDQAKPDAKRRESPPFPSPSFHKSFGIGPLPFIPSCFLSR